ncbi:MAG: AMP-binding protein, partial [Polyangiaceae bacterium]|nr:AMP-binding protein [Polyangiaceae bacterium]
MLDLAAYQELKPAPRAVFDRLAERQSRVRFMVPEGDDWRAVTWGAHARHIRGISSFLVGEGLESGERAAIYAHNSVEWMEAAMAIQAAGGVLVPIYPASTASQAGYVARHSDATVLFVEGAELFGRLLDCWHELAGVRRIVLLGQSLDAGELVRRHRAPAGPAGRVAPAVDEVVARVVSWEHALERGLAADRAAPGAFDARLAGLELGAGAIMLYTSGTTGNPKGVPLTHANVAHNGRDWMRCFAPLLAENDVDLLWLPMSHVFGLGEACIGNSLGYTTYLADPGSVLRRLPEVRPDVFMSVPAYWEKIAQAALSETDPEEQRARLDAVTGGRLRFCLSGGAGLKREVKEICYRHGLLILEGYGLSECSPSLTLNRPNDFRFDSVGKPLDSVQLELAPDGEILAKGPNVFAGYHKEPEATRETFTEDGWLKTGDVGRFTEDGFLQIIDRKKEILVTAGGKNVPPANIELRFATDPLFAHVVVYGDGKKYLTAGLWLAEDELAARLARDGVPAAEREAAARRYAEAAVERVNAELAKYEQVKKFALMRSPLTVAGGLLTTTLKVRRKKVYEAFRNEYEALYEDS